MSVAGFDRIYATLSMIMRKCTCVFVVLLRKLQEFSLTLGQSSGASVLPWVVGAVTGNMAGWGADALVNKVRS